MTFYDNHDMARMNATASGFIDAHNWLFTARGIPVVYYGSEIAFMAGDKEHEGNRNYFGPEGIAHARKSRIHAALSASRAPARTPALQRGLQVNLELEGDRAAFYRVYERGEAAQTALVLLNKGDASATFSVDRYLEPARGATPGGKEVKVRKGKALVAEVAAHGVRVLLKSGRTDDPALRAELNRAMTAWLPPQAAERPPQEARTTSSGAIRVDSMAWPSIRRMRFSTSISPARCVSCRTVVSGGLKSAAEAMSSKPTTATSWGTETPRSCSAWITPIAIRSLAANTASNGMPASMSSIPRR